jgi:hypothetical protein
MLSIAHSATGAFIAVTINPILIIPVIFASHYLEDWIPHWDVGTGLSSGKRTRRDAMILEIVELGISVVVVYALFQSGHSGFNTLAWLGAFLALIPDFLEAPRNFLKKEPAIIKPLNELHKFFHHSTPNMLVGLAPQLAVIAAIWALR